MCRKREHILGVNTPRVAEGVVSRRISRDSDEDVNYFFHQSSVRSGVMLERT